MGNLREKGPAHGRVDHHDAARPPQVRPPHAHGSRKTRSDSLRALPRSLLFQTGYSRSIPQSRAMRKKHRGLSCRGMVLFQRARRETQSLANPDACRHPAGSRVTRADRSRHTPRTARCPGETFRELGREASFRFGQRNGDKSRRECDLPIPVRGAAFHRAS